VEEGLQEFSPVILIRQVCATLCRLFQTPDLYWRDLNGTLFAAPYGPSVLNRKVKIIVFMDVGRFKAWGFTPLGVLAGSLLLGCIIHESFRDELYYRLAVVPFESITASYRA